MQQYIGFHLNNNEYMIPILRVREIITMPSITVLPNLPSYIKGITNLRGSVIPVVNLKNLLNSNGSSETGKVVIVISAGKITFGIIVDGITGVVKIDEANIEAPEKIISGNADLLEGVAKFDNRLIVLLNTKKILPVDDISLLEDTMVTVSSVENGGNVEVIREIDTIGGKVTVRELHNAKDLLTSKLDKNDPKHKIFELMIHFMDALSANEYEKMEGISNQLVMATDSGIFTEVGKITRKLHNSLEDFRGTINTGLQRLAQSDVPTAVDNLQFVISRTEDAANKTMGIVERYFEESNDFSRHLESIKGQEEAAGYFKSFKDSLDNDMTLILTAQQFQDITGQTIKKVIDLVNNVEVELLKLIAKFGILTRTEPDKIKVGAASELYEEDEPIEKSIEKVTQSDVEALLNDFGF
jgi:chemotaxis protein CheZ